jgi:hypothetical protein
MTAKSAVRVCAGCGTRLARDNTGRWCGPCTRDARAGADRPPVVPLDFWYAAQMLDAFESWHMGRVILAYRTHPHHGKSLSQLRVCEWLGLTQAQLSRIETSHDGPADLGKLIRYAQLFGMPPELLWFKLPSDHKVMALAHVDSPGGDDSILDVGQDGPVDRRKFITATAGAGLASMAAPALDLLASLGHAPVPAEVRPSDIDQVRASARLFTNWDHAYGGEMVRETVTAQLRWSAELLEAKCPPGLRADLFAAVGALSGVCGLMAFDAYSHDDARRMFTFGLTCAEEADDWHLRAKLLSNLARQAIWCGDPDAGLTNTELALVRADRLTATELAMLYAGRARAFGKLGQVQQTLAAVGHADEAFARASPGDDPPWMTYYDQAQHYGDTAHALFDLAIHDVPNTEAALRLAEAVRSHSHAYARSRAFSGAKLASLLMATGDPREASPIGQRAIDDAGRVRSRRAADTLRELRRLAGCHADLPEVADLRERITQLVGQA